MRSKPGTLVALDIGTSKIAMLIGRVSSAPAGGQAVGDPQPMLDIIGYGSAPSRGLRKGVVINIEATVEGISQARHQAETMAGTEVHHVFANVGGSHIRSLNSHGVVGVKGKEVTASDIERVIEAAKAVAIPVDREILHVLPQEFILDGQDGIKDPLGMAGVRLEAKVHIITGSIASAQNVVKCANRCDLTVRDVLVPHIASADAVLSPEEREIGVCLLEIGSGTTNIAVFHNSAARYTGVIPIGGAHLTNDIASGLHTPLAAAEEIKKRHGIASTTVASRNSDTLEVPTAGGRPPRVISRQVLAEIIEPRLEELMTLVHKELQRAGCLSLLTSGIVLTGGSSQLHGLPEFIENHFSAPVRIGRPLGVSGLVDLVGTPESATVVGLAFAAARSVRRNELHGQGGGVFRNITRRVNAWFSGE